MSAITELHEACASPAVIAETIADFLSSLTARNYSPLTVAAYGKTLAAISQRGDLLQSTGADLRRFFAAMGDVAPATRSRHVAAIKTFARFLRNTGAADSDSFIRAAESLRGPRKRAALPKALTVEQASAVVDHVSVPSNSRPAWEVARERALVLLMYGAGLRSAEVLGLPMNYETADNVLRIVGKGRRERLVPLLPVVLDALAAYRRLYQEAKGQTADILFPGFSDRDLRRMMQRIRERLGLPDNATPHSLRHSFATHIYQSGGDIRILADLLGHASVSTTAIYMKTDAATLLRVLQRCAPERYGVCTQDQ